MLQCLCLLESFAVLLEFESTQFIAFGKYFIEMLVLAALVVEVHDLELVGLAEGPYFEVEILIVAFCQFEGSLDGLDLVVEFVGVD